MIEFIRIAGATGISDTTDGYVVYFGDISRMITDDELLEAYKLQKIIGLKNDCTNAIQAGFTSTALGEAHTYDSELPQDQTNLLGAKLAGINMDFTCTDNTGYKLQKFHTAAQIAQIYSDGMSHIQATKALFYARKWAVEQGATINDVEAVTW